MACIIDFPKVLVGVLNGSAVGLGVTILPLLDLVICINSVGWTRTSYKKNCILVYLFIAFDDIFFLLTNLVHVLVRIYSKYVMPMKYRLVGTSLV